MSDGRKANGGRRAGAGRKTKRDEEAISALFDAACDEAARETIIRAVAARAQAGDVQAATFIFNRLYGTPVSGGEIRLREAIEAELGDFFKAMEKSLTPQSWREVQTVFQMESEGAASTRTSQSGAV
jgi:hypothetical protein